MGDGQALQEFVAAIREEREPVSSIYDCVEIMRLYQLLYDAHLARLLVMFGPCDGEGGTVIEDVAEQSPWNTL